MSVSRYRYSIDQKITVSDGVATPIMPDRSEGYSIKRMMAAVFNQGNETVYLTVGQPEDQGVGIPVDPGSGWIFPPEYVPITAIYATVEEGGADTVLQIHEGIL